MNQAVGDIAIRGKSASLSMDSKSFVSLKKSLRGSTSPFMERLLQLSLRSSTARDALVEAIHYIRRIVGSPARQLSLQLLSSASPLERKYPLHLRPKLEKSRMSSSSVTTFVADALKLEGPKMIVTQELQAREEEFRRELVDGPPVQDLARAFSAVKAEDFGAAVEDFFLVLNTFNNDGEGKDGDVAYYGNNLKKDIEATDLIGRMRVVVRETEGGGTQRFIWWQILYCLECIYETAHRVPWEGRLRTGDVRVMWNRMKLGVRDYISRLIKVVQPVGILEQAHLALSSHLVHRDDDEDSEVPVSILALTLTQVEEPEVKEDVSWAAWEKPRTFREPAMVNRVSTVKLTPKVNSRRDMRKHYRVLDGSLIDDTLSLFRSTLKQIQSRLQNGTSSASLKVGLERTVDITGNDCEREPLHRSQKFDQQVEFNDMSREQLQVWRDGLDLAVSKLEAFSLGQSERAYHLSLALARSSILDEMDEDRDEMSRSTHGRHITFSEEVQFQSRPPTPASSEDGSDVTREDPIL